jgi:hypothetical protein
VPIVYDEDFEALAVMSGHCEDCGKPLYDTGCDAPGCRGYCCMDCGTGCDIEFDREHGRCATALAEESDEDYTERVNAERAAFGLSPLGGTETTNA